jgi:hypothetical protein
VLQDCLGVITPHVYIVSCFDAGGPLACMLLLVIAGTWQGTDVAIKTMILPAAMSGKEKREKMAIMVRSRICCCPEHLHLCGII